MMQLVENRSQVWFKVLSGTGKTIDGSQEKWSLPKGEQKGDWMEFDNQLGTWLVSDPLQFYQEGNLVFVAELSIEPSVERPGIVWMQKVRLLRQATELDLKRFGIFPSHTSNPQSNG